MRGKHSDNMNSTLSTSPHFHGASVSSFYHLDGRDLQHERCQGPACFVARHRSQRESKEAGAHSVYCLGKCYMGPASGADSGLPHIAVHARQGIVLSRLAKGGAPSLEQYIAAGGYQALRKALSLSPSNIIDQLDASSLRGRGGAGFPAGKKWRSVLLQQASEKFVVANADEGDAGAYIDRFLLEGDPHSILEALAIAGHAVGAQRAYIYLRKEYPAAAERVKRALEEATRAHFLGENLLGSRRTFHVELVIGSGSYVCGEETALLNALEGKRPQSRTRPPYPTEQGFKGAPTLISNVETLANVPWIILNGGEAYCRLGFSESRGTKAISLNSLFLNPGLYEVEFGISLRDIVEQIGGGLVSGSLRGVIVGGPLAGVIPPHLLDTLFGFEELRAIGGTVGHGGIVAFDEHTSVLDLLRNVFEFGAFESCGTCTPCRAGTRRILELLDGKRGPKPEFEAVVNALQLTSLCGLGSGLAAFASSIIRYYGQELSACFA